MKKILLVFTILLFTASTALAQASNFSKLIWDQAVDAVVTSAVVAQGLTYRYYPDNNTTGVVLTGVTCIGTTTITCTATFPAFTPGTHSLTLTAAVTNVSQESPKSNPLNFTFAIVPGVPGNLRIGS